MPESVPRLDVAAANPQHNASASQVRPLSPQSSVSLDNRCHLPTATTLATPRSAMPPVSPRSTSPGGFHNNGSMAAGGSMAVAAEENTFSITPYIAGLPDLDQIIGLDPHRLCLDVRRAHNLHGFELTELLSEGSFGKLHRAVFEKTGEWFVREFPADVSHHDIAREVRYFLRSVSPYTLPVKRILTDGLNVKYLLLHGGNGGTTLTKWVTDHFTKTHQEKAKKPNYRAFADIMSCVFGALYDLHQDAVIHGNLHSDTIIVRESPSGENQFAVALLDFNLACVGHEAGPSQNANRPPPNSQHKQHGFVINEYPEGTIAFQHEAGDSRRVCEATDNYAVGVIILRYLCRCTAFLSEHDSKMSEVSMPSDHSDAKMNALIDKLRDTLPKDEKSSLFQLLETAARAIRVDATATALNHFVQLFKLASRNEKGPVRMYATRIFSTLQEFKDSGRCWTRSQELIITTALDIVRKGECTRGITLDTLSNHVARLHSPSFVLRQPMIALMVHNTCEVMRASGMTDERITVLLAESNHILGRPAMDPFACVAQTFSPEMRARISIPIIADMLSGTLSVSVDLRAQADRFEELIKSCTTSGNDMRTVANLRFAVADIYTHIGTRAAIERSLFHATEGFKYFKEIQEKELSGFGKQDYQNGMHACTRAMERAAHSRFIRSHDKGAAATELMEAVHMLKSILPADIEDSQDPFDAMTLYSLACLLQNVACRYRVDNEATCTKLLSDAFDYIQEGLQILRRSRVGPHFLLVVRFELQREMLHRLISTESKGREGILGCRPDSQITPDCGDSHRHQTVRRLHLKLAERPPTDEEVLEVMTEIYELEHAPSQRAKALLQKADFLMAIGQPLVAKRLYQTAMATFDRTQDERTIIGTSVLAAREASGDKAPTPGKKSGEITPRSGNRSPTKKVDVKAAASAPTTAIVVTPTAKSQDTKRSATTSPTPEVKPSRVSHSTDPSTPKAPGRTSPSIMALAHPPASHPSSQPHTDVKTTNPIPEEYGRKNKSPIKGGKNGKNAKDHGHEDDKKKKGQHQKVQSNVQDEGDFIDVPSAGTSQTDQHGQMSSQLPNAVPELRS